MTYIIGDNGGIEIVEDDGSITSSLAIGQYKAREFGSSDVNGVAIYRVAETETPTGQFQAPQMIWGIHDYTTFTINGGSPASALDAVQKINVLLFNAAGSTTNPISITNSDLNNGLNASPQTIGLGCYLITDGADMGVEGTVVADINGHKYFNPEAVAIFNNPDFTDKGNYSGINTVSGLGTYLGIWNSGLTPIAGDTVLNTGMGPGYYVNLTGVNTATHPFADTTNWGQIQQYYWNAINEITTIHFDTLVGLFLQGETVTGGNGSTGVITNIDNVGMKMSITISSSLSTWLTETTLTGGTSGATADITSFTPSQYRDNMVVIYNGWQYVVQDETLFTGSNPIGNSAYTQLSKQPTNLGYIATPTPVLYNVATNDANGNTLVSSPVSGDTISLDNSISQLYIVESGGFDGLTITVPSSPFNGQTLKIVSTQTITSVTASGLLGFGGTLTLDTSYSWQGNSVIAAWMAN